MAPKIRISAPGITSAIFHYSRIPPIPTHHLKLKEFNAHPNVLYCRVHAYNKVLSKYKTVRAWVTRRVKNAMTEALRHKGFDRLGRRVVAPEHACRSNGQLDLTGMIIIQPRSTAITVKFETLKKEMGLVVDNIAEVCSEP